MKTSASWIARLRRDTRGANLVEYVIIAGVIALFAMTAFRAFGQALFAKTRAQALVIASLEGEGGGGGGSCIGGLCMNGNCFVAGTLVATPEGDRPIERLRVGDVVLTRDERTLEVTPHRVVRTFVTPEMPVVSVRVRERPLEVLRATPGHRFWTADRSWIAAEELTPGEELASSDKTALHVESVERDARAGTDGTETVYNFEVEGTHTYFVGAAHVLVHNPTDPVAGGCGGSGGGGGSSGSGSGGTSSGGTSSGAGGGTGGGSGGGSGSASSGGASSGGSTATLKWGNWKSTPTYGHTFSEHGSQNTKGLTGEAGGTGQSQGQWLDNSAAAAFLAAQRSNITGPTTVSIPPGLGRVINPDGSSSPATKAILVPSPNGGYRTAYPIP